MTLTKESLREALIELADWPITPANTQLVESARFVERLLPDEWCLTHGHQCEQYDYHRCDLGQLWDEGLVEVVKKAFTQAAYSAMDDDAEARAVLAALAEAARKESSPGR